MLQNMNVVALERALDVLVGPQYRAITLALYGEIDAAMHRGYEMGKAEAEGAYQHGFQAGHAFSVEHETGAAYDEGYCDGVDDARVRPAVADAVIEDIMADEAQVASEQLFDYDLVRDSGDEQVQDEY